MATDDRPTDDGTPKRRGKAPTITLEASEVAQETAAAGTPSAPDGTSRADSPATAASPEAVAEAPAAESSQENPAAAPAAAPSPALVDPPAAEPDGTFREPPPRAMAEAPPEAPRPAMTPSAAQTPGFGRLAAAGIIGALLTGGLGVAAQVGGVLPGQSRDRMPALEARVDELNRILREVSARPAPVAAAAPVDLAPITGRLEVLDAARARLETRIAALEQRPAPVAASATPGDAAAPADITAINREIEALKVAVEAIAGAQRNLAAVASSAPAASVPAADPGAIDARIRSATAPQVDRIAGLETALTALRREVEAAAAAGKTAETRIAALDANRMRASDIGQRAALVVALGTLRAAVERGGTFAPELRTALALGLPAEAARPLSAAAERGLPTQAQIAQRFAVLAPALVKAAPGAGASGGILDRLATSAQNLVRVRPIGEAAGDDVPTAVSRIEAKLGRGDLGGGLADFDRLPEPVRAIGANWATEARARHAADEALRRLAGDAVQSLTGG
ncbi:MAG: hypothetical protein JNK84_17810 [Phreatobacter sp.]|uniref:COG4223 family protein n=1 Tax=Phreatobacter sp. TaxID=1966341 RepID=UPI001A60E4F1|nr:hypothetical protein [Phreatobacter sp.]MBL8570930.1 hypothetical protein [Phreatobacter sp.]